MKRTNKERVDELNMIIKDVEDYEFGVMPKGYAPYCLIHKGSVYAGGYFVEVRKMALRMKFAAQANRDITFDVIFGIRRK